MATTWNKTHTKSDRFGASGEKEWILPLNIISCNSPISISKIEDSHTPVETNADPAGSVDAGTSTNHYLGMFSCCFLLHCLLYAAALLYSSPNPNTGKTLKKGLLWLHDFENQQCYHRYTTPNEPTSPKTNKETSTIESLSAERAYTTQETSPSPRRKTVDNP